MNINKNKEKIIYNNDTYTKILFIYFLKYILLIYLHFYIIFFN